MGRRTAPRNTAAQTVTQRVIETNREQKKDLLLQLFETRGLHQVLTNLIDNAIKYSRRSTPPTLGIKAACVDGQCHFSVTDNGIGFDMKYHDRIFGLFNRLVRSAEFEGTGAGLAIVKKLVKKIGGQVRAESTPDQVATFFLDLPSQPNPPTRP